MEVSKKEKLDKIEKRLQQLKAQKQDILNREKEKERKERTRRLIQNGALAEKYLNCEDMQPEEFQKFIEKIAEIPEVKRLLINSK